MEVTKRISDIFKPVNAIINILNKILRKHYFGSNRSKQTNRVKKLE